MTKPPAPPYPRRLARPVGLAAIAGCLLLFGCDRPSEQEIHQRELIAAGRASYRAYCEGCHGHEARGDGPTAVFLTIPPADLTRIAQRHGGTFPQEYVYLRIEGTDAGTSPDSTKMPHWGKIWNVNDTPQEREDAKARTEELLEYIRSSQE